MRARRGAGRAFAECIRAVFGLRSECGPNVGRMLRIWLGAGDAPRERAPQRPLADAWPLRRRAMLRARPAAYPTPPPRVLARHARSATAANPAAPTASIVAASHSAGENDPACAASGAAASGPAI